MSHSFWLCDVNDLGERECFSLRFYISGYFWLRIYELFKVNASDLLKTFVVLSKMYDSIRNMRLAEYLARMYGLE